MARRSGAENIRIAHLEFERHVAEATATARVLLMND